MKVCETGMMKLLLDKLDNIVMIFSNDMNDFINTHKNTEHDFIIYKSDDVSLLLYNMYYSIRYIMK